MEWILSVDGAEYEISPDELDSVDLKDLADEYADNGVSEDSELLLIVSGDTFTASQVKNLQETVEDDFGLSFGDIDYLSDYRADLKSILNGDQIIRSWDNYNDFAEYLFDLVAEMTGINWDDRPANDIYWAVDTNKLVERAIVTDDDRFIVDGDIIYEIS
ncbi:TPA: hypothetical protein ACGNDF_001515 [Streptococcus agalactiae]